MQSFCRRACGLVGGDRLVGAARRPAASAQDARWEGMMEKPVQSAWAAESGIATLTFNRPAVFNALDIAMAEAFEVAVAELEERPVRCVVLTGAGKAFMAGGDVAAFAADLDGASRTLGRILNSMHPALIALRRLEAPVVAAVNGVAAGAGFSLALAADYVIARQSARFVLAYDKLGVVPDCGGSWFLSRKVGRPIAFALMLTGRSFTAEEGRAAGFVNAVTADGEFDAAVAALSAQIAAGPTQAFGMFKRLMDADQPLAAHMELEREFFTLATDTDDFRTAATAFVHKTPATFRGR